MTSPLRHLDFINDMSSTSTTTRPHQYRGFAIPVGPKSVLFFKIGTLEISLWFCKVQVLKSDDGVKSDDSDVVYQNMVAAPRNTS
jgi:hypothetical protein